MYAAKTIRGIALLTAMGFLAACAPATAAERGRLAIRVRSAELSCPIPYRTGKAPVVFIHGMLGSPDNWSVMTEQLGADPAVQANFQPLVFRYDSLQSIPDAGRDLLDALREARRQFDPEGRDAAFDRVILVGHSMGGLVAKSAIRARDSGSLAVDDPPRVDRGETQAMPKIARVIFVSDAAPRLSGRSRCAAVDGELDRPGRQPVIPGMGVEGDERRSAGLGQSAAGGPGTGPRRRGRPLPLDHRHTPRPVGRRSDRRPRPGRCSREELERSQVGGRRPNASYLLPAPRSDPGGPQDSDRASRPFLATRTGRTGGRPFIADSAAYPELVTAPTS